MKRSDGHTYEGELEFPLQESARFPVVFANRKLDIGFFTKGFVFNYGREFYLKYNSISHIAVGKKKDKIELVIVSPGLQIGYTCSKNVEFYDEAVKTIEKLVDEYTNY